jgi:hypothetical protein
VWPGGLIASVEIYCDFLAVNGWQVEGKRSIFGHGGCGALRLHEAVRLNTDLLCETATSRYSRRKISTDDELSGLGDCGLLADPSRAIVLCRLDRLDR